MIPPSGRVPERGLDWFSVATEAFGGGTPDLGFFLEVSVFIGIFGVGAKQRGATGRPRDRGARPLPRARPPPSRAARGSPGPPLLLRGLLLVQKKS